MNRERTKPLARPGRGAWKLQRGEWSESSRTMDWKSAAADPNQFATRCTFENATTLRCSTQVKDGKGGVAIDQESVALRRRQ